MAELVVKLVNGELAGKTMQSITKEISAAARELKKAEIGTKQWVDAQKRLEDAKSLQEDLKEQIENTASASDLLKEAWNRLPGAGFFNEIGQSFGLMRKGVGGLTTQFGALKVAIASTGLGLLLVALGSLVSYFTTVQEGMDKVTRVTKPLSVIFERLKGVVQDLGERVFGVISDAVDNPRKAFENLGNIIKQNLINRFEALALFGPALKKIFSGDIAEGFEDLGNATIQLTTGVEDGIDKIKQAAESTASFVKESIDQGLQLADMEKSIEEAEINQIKRSKELELTIKQQKLLLEDTTKSYGERRAAAEAAMNAQDQLLRLELDLIDQRIAKMKLEQSFNDTSREEQKELAELEAQRLEKEAQITDQRIEFRNKLNELDANNAAEAAARDAEELKRRQEQAQKELEIRRNLEDLKIEAMEEGMQKEIEKVALDTERKIAALQGSEEQIREQRKLLQEIQEKEILEIKDKYAKIQEQEDEKLAEKQKKIAEDKANFIRELEEIRISTAQEAAAAVGELIAQEAKDEASAKAIKKTFALVDIGINLQKELSANALAAAANPLNAVTFGAAGAAQLATNNTAAIVRAAIAAARVIAFRRGGWLGGLLKGPSHEGGGIPGVITSTGQPIELEGDEFIFSRRAVRAIGVQRLMRINDMFTRKMEVGGPVDPFVQSDISSASPSSSPSFGVTEDFSRLENYLVRTMEEIKAWRRDLRVINVVSDTAEGIRTLNRIQADADV